MQGEGLGIAWSTHPLGLGTSQQREASICTYSGTASPGETYFIVFDPQRSGDGFEIAMTPGRVHRRERLTGGWPEIVGAVGDWAYRVKRELEAARLLLLLQQLKQHAGTGLPAIDVARFSAAVVRASTVADSPLPGDIAQQLETAMLGPFSVLGQRLDRESEKADARHEAQRAAITRIHEDLRSRIEGANRLGRKDLYNLLLSTLLQVVVTEGTPLLKEHAANLLGVLEGLSG